MGFNYTGFQQYRMNLSKMAVQFDQWLTNFLLNRGLAFIASVKLRTPVDTGDLRNHWTLDSQPITRKGDTLHVWFVNPMEYTTFVEYGHSKPYKAGAQPGSPDWVDGHFMMTVALDEIQRSMPQEFDAEFTKFVKRLGVL